MTEQEWLRAINPQPLLEFLRYEVSDRKLRLFVVACCRRIYHPWTDEQTREAVEIGEQFADGLASDSARHDALEKLLRMREQAVAEDDFDRAAWLRDIQYPVDEDMIAGTTHVPGAWHERDITHDPAWPPSSAPCPAEWSPRRGGCQFLRDIFGPLPFRPITLDPAWLTWHGGLLVSMAQQMYDSRDFTDLPILADALEEAGCTDADLLGHLRGPGPHVRGCWAVDLLLGKS